MVYDSRVDIIKHKAIEQSKTKTSMIRASWSSCAPFPGFLQIGDIPSTASGCEPWAPKMCPQNRPKDAKILMEAVLVLWSASISLETSWNHFENLLREKKTWFSSPSPKKNGSWKFSSPITNENFPAQTSMATSGCASSPWPLWHLLDPIGRSWGSASDYDPIPMMEGHCIFFYPGQR